MDVGIVVPQGWTGEFRGMGAAEAWARSVAIAQEADALGFESLWLFDHLHAEAGEGMTFEAFTALAALAALTDRARLGHIVTCAGYRNPALAAKTIATLDVISGGRAELGIGAGWYAEEYAAYGYPFPSARERLDLPRGQPGDRHAGCSRPGRPPTRAAQASIRAAFNEPRGLQEPRIPLIVGGNGRERTWRLAAQVRRRAQPRRADAGGPPRVDADHPRPLRGDRS